MPTECSTRGSYIYVVAVVGHDIVKVGRSANPRARFSSLQTGCPLPLELLGFWPLPASHAVAVEAELHEELAKPGERIRGEWFAIGRDIAVGFVEGTVRDVIELEAEGWYAE